MIESVQNTGVQALAAAQVPKEVQQPKVETPKVEAAPIQDTVKISPEAKEKLKEEEKPPEEATVTTNPPPAPEEGAKADPQMAAAVKAYTAA